MSKYENILERAAYDEAYVDILSIFLDIATTSSAYEDALMDIIGKNAYDNIINKCYEYGLT